MRRGTSVLVLLRRLGTVVPFHLSFDRMLGPIGQHTEERECREQEP
jgi:hypothetical protein